MNGDNNRLEEKVEEKRKEEQLKKLESKIRKARMVWLVLSIVEIVLGVTLIACNHFDIEPLASFLGLAIIPVGLIMVYAVGMYQGLIIAKGAK